MEKTAFDARYQEYLAAIEDYLNSLFAEKPHWADLYEAMRYSVLSGGKRLRPVMTLEFARLCGLDWHKAVPVGCALELVHTYSLIHDDLPCMDDDDLRRGKPTNHKVYGETLAVLAGDALQPAAYRLILTAPGLTDAQRADCALILANASGPDGMVAGQVLDTLHHPSAQDELTEVHHLKTGAMIAGACMLGVGAAGGRRGGPEGRGGLRLSAGPCLPDPGRYAGRHRKRRRIRQAHRLRQGRGQGHLCGPAGTGRLRQADP